MNDLPPHSKGGVETPTRAARKETSLLDHEDANEFAFAESAYFDGELPTEETTKLEALRGETLQRECEVMAQVGQVVRDWFEHETSTMSDRSKDIWARIEADIEAQAAINRKKRVVLWQWRRIGDRLTEGVLDALSPKMFAPVLGLLLLAFYMGTLTGEPVEKKLLVFSGTQSLANNSGSAQTLKSLAGDQSSIPVVASVSQDALGSKASSIYRGVNPRGNLFSEMQSSSGMQSEQRESGSPRAQVFVGRSDKIYPAELFGGRAEDMPRVVFLKNKVKESLNTSQLIGSGKLQPGLRADGLEIDWINAHGPIKLIPAVGRKSSPVIWVSQPKQ